MRRVRIEALDERPAFEDEVQDAGAGEETVHFEKFVADAHVASCVIGIGLRHPLSSIWREESDGLGLSPRVVQQGGERVPVGVMGQPGPVHIAGRGESDGDLSRGGGEMQGGGHQPGGGEEFFVHGCLGR